jgi:hypothetical protein
MRLASLFVGGVEAAMVSMTGTAGSLFLAGLLSTEVAVVLPPLPSITFGPVIAAFTDADPFETRAAGVEDGWIPLVSLELDAFLALT